MKKSLLALIALSALFTFGCSKKSPNKSIAVFVPGICDNSPTYAMLVEGITNAVKECNETKSDEDKIELFVMEAGTNQAEWGPKITALAAEQKYDVIISSNPSLGYIAALMSKTHYMGLIAAQEYPVMNNILYPYFEKGGKAANPQTTVDFRVVGNWYDATKGAEITDALSKKDVDVILPICGGASQGVISSAVNKGIYITWFDNNGFDKAPGTIISSCIMEQVKMAEKVTKEFLEGKTAWGQAHMVGIKDGFVSFVDDDPNYLSVVPASIRQKMTNLVEKIKSGELTIY